MNSITISVTIPTVLEEALKREADTLGLSRSRCVCNILQRWNESKIIPLNDCIHNTRGACSYYSIVCDVLQEEAERCHGYTIK